MLQQSPLRKTRLITIVEECKEVAVFSDEYCSIEKKTSTSIVKSKMLREMNKLKKKINRCRFYRVNSKTLSNEIILEKLNTYARSKYILLSFRYCKLKHCYNYISKFKGDCFLMTDANCFCFDKKCIKCHYKRYMANQCLLVNNNDLKTRLLPNIQYLSK